MCRYWSGLRGLCTETEWVHHKRGVWVQQNDVLWRCTRRFIEADWGWSTSDSDTHIHTRLNHLLSASVITDLTSFLHVKAAKPFVHTLTRSHTSSKATVIADEQSAHRMRRFWSVPSSEWAPRTNPVSSKDKCVGLEYLFTLQESGCDVMRRLDKTYYPQEKK